MPLQQAPETSTSQSSPSSTAHSKRYRQASAILQEHVCPAAAAGITVCCTVSQPATYDALSEHPFSSQWFTFCGRAWDCVVGSDTDMTSQLEIRNFNTAAVALLPALWLHGVSLNTSHFSFFSYFEFKKITQTVKASDLVLQHCWTSNALQSAVTAQCVMRAF